MFLLFYLAVLAGLWLLILDVRGGLRASASKTRLMRVVGLLSAVGPGLVPLLGWKLGWWDVGPGLLYPAIAYSYLVLFVLFVIGVVARRGLWLRRAAYLALLLLAALPSWVLLALAPAVALAGMALVRPRL